MIEYRVLEKKWAGRDAVVTSKFYPQYKRTFYGIGWWQTFDAFCPSDRNEPAKTKEEAEAYIASRNKLKNEYYYE